MHEGILRVSTASAQTWRPSWHLLDLHSGARTNQRARWQLCNSMELLYSLHATKSTVSNYIVCVCVFSPQASEQIFYGNTEGVLLSQRVSVLVHRGAQRGIRHMLFIRSVDKKIKEIGFFISPTVPFKSELDARSLENCLILVIAVQQHFPWQSLIKLKHFWVTCDLRYFRRTWFLYRVKNNPNNLLKAQRVLSLSSFSKEIKRHRVSEPHKCIWFCIMAAQNKTKQCLTRLFAWRDETESLCRQVIAPPASSSLWQTESCTRTFSTTLRERWGTRRRRLNGSGKS